MLRKIHIKAILISLGVFLFSISCTIAGFILAKRALEQKNSFFF